MGKRLKNQAKLEYDRIVSVTPFKGKVGPDGIKVNVRSQLKRELMDSLPGSALREQVTDFPGYMLGLPEKGGAETHPLRNPFDIPRHRLLDQLVRMRANLIGRGRGKSATQLVDSDTRHSLPIGQMGNYQDYLKKQPLPLRELESQPVRQHMFGNPFKINKNLMMTDEVSGIVDEVQLVGVSGPQGAGGRGVKRSAEQGGASMLHPAPPKRRKGALPKDFQFVSPSSSPSHSIEHYPSPPPSPSVLPPLVSTSLPPQQTPYAPPSLPRPPLSNGVGVPGLGPVYPGGKMAAFRSLCDTSDLDSDGEAPLVILEQVEPGKRDREEDEEVDEDEFEQVKVINHIKSGVDDDLICLSNSPVAVMEATSRDKVNNTQGDLVIRSTANGDNGLGSPHPSPPTSPSPENTQPSPSSSPEPSEPSAEELRSIRLRNNNVRQLIYKEVKKPGRGHAELWDMLASLHGPPIVRRQFIQEVRQEAVR